MGNEVKNSFATGIKNNFYSNTPIAKQNKIPYLQVELKIASISEAVASMLELI